MSDATGDAIDQAPARRAPMLLLVAMMSASQLAITIHLAALPALPELLETTQAMVQNTITLYLFAFAAAQLFVGPLSDALGRKPMAVAGLGIFTAAGIATTLAPTIEFLIAARIVQALGACSGIVLSRAIVRDCYTGQKSTKAMAYLAIAMAVMPAVAPFVGAELFVLFGWRSVFGATALIGGAVLVATVATLPETLPKELRRPLRIGGLLRGYGRLVTKRRYMTYSFSISFLTASFNGYLVAIPMVLIVVMGVREEVFGLYTMATPAGFMLGNFLAARLVHRFDGDAIVRAGQVLCLLAGLILIVLSWTQLAAPLTIFGPLFLFFLGNGLVLPNCLAGALNSVERSHAGAASALTGFIQMSLSGLVTVVLGFILIRSAMPMALMMAVAATLSIVSFTAMPRRKEQY